MRVQLGNLYFDSERFQDAAKWYEEALKINPRDADASTDLGIAYYYMNQPDARSNSSSDRWLLDPAIRRPTEHRRRPRVRQTGSRGRGEGLAEGHRARARFPGGPCRQQALEGVRNAHPDVGAPRQEPEAMIGWALRILLVLLVVRALWRLIKGVFEGAGYTARCEGSAAGPSWFAIRSAASTFPRQGAVAHAHGQTALLLFRAMPEQWETGGKRSAAVMPWPGGGGSL